MKIAHRFAYYGAGFIVGLVLLFFFLGGKKTSCDYGFDARTLKNIRTKKLVISQLSEQNMRTLNIDTAAIHFLLKRGDVDFSETDRSLDSCKIYLIHDVYREQNIQLRIKNCNKEAEVLDVGLRE